MTFVDFIVCGFINGWPNQRVIWFIRNHSDLYNILGVQTQIEVTSSASAKVQATSRKHCQLLLSLGTRSN